MTKNNEDEKREQGLQAMEQEFSSKNNEGKRTLEDTINLAKQQAAAKPQPPQDEHKVKIGSLFVAHNSYPEDTKEHLDEPQDCWCWKRSQPPNIEPNIDIPALNIPTEYTRAAAKEVIEQNKEALRQLPPTEILNKDGDTHGIYGESDQSADVPKKRRVRCNGCGQLLPSWNTKHTYNDCEIYKAKSQPPAEVDNDLTTKKVEVVNKDGEIHGMYGESPTEPTGRYICPHCGDKVLNKDIQPHMTDEHPTIDACRKCWGKGYLLTDPSKEVLPPLFHTECHSCKGTGLSQPTKLVIAVKTPDGGYVVVPNEPPTTDQTKPVVEIKDWYFKGRRLVGVVKNHPLIEDGSPVVTSKIIRVETRNSIYELSQPTSGQTDGKCKHCGMELGKDNWCINMCSIMSGSESVSPTSPQPRQNAPSELCELCGQEMNANCNNANCDGKGVGE